MTTVETIEQVITNQTEAIERALSTLRDAQDFRQRLEEARRAASGRLSEGDPVAMGDVERLGRELVEARHAVQDAEEVVRRARERLPKLNGERKSAERHEAIARLVPLLDLRAGLAEEFEARIRDLAVTAQFFTASVEESRRLASELNLPAGGVVNERHKTLVARRLLLVLKPLLAPEFSSLPVTIEPPMPKADADALAVLREWIDREPGRAS